MIEVNGRAERMDVEYAVGVLMQSPPARVTAWAAPKRRAAASARAWMVDAEGERAVATRARQMG